MYFVYFQAVLCTLVVLSERARTLTSRLSVVSAPLGRVSENAVPNCTTDGTPGCRSKSGCSKRSPPLATLRIIGFRRKDRTGYKPLSYREVLERTGSERIETTIRKRQLGFAGALVWQGDSRLSKRVLFGRLAVQGPKRGGRPATSWVDCLQKNLEAFGAVPRKGKGRKWVAFGVVVKDGRDWMTAAKNVGKWHRGVEKGAEALDSAWRRADLRQSNVQRQREVSEVVQ